MLGALGWYRGFQNKCEVQLCPVQRRKKRSCSFSICFALSMQEVFFFLSFKAFVSVDDLHLLFFPMNSFGVKCSDFCSVWKCVIDMVFDTCADVFEIFNDSREYFWLFFMV